MEKTFYFYFVFLAISWATPAAHGGSQARPMPEPQQRRIRASSATYTTAHGNAGSLTHWVRAGTEPATSWFLVGFVNHWATMGTPIIAVLFYFILFYLFIYFCLFAISWAAPATYGGSQARGRIGAVAAGLRQSHSNAGYQMCLWLIPQLITTPGP